MDVLNRGALPFGCAEFNRACSALKDGRAAFTEMLQQDRQWDEPHEWVKQERGDFCGDLPSERFSADFARANFCATEGPLVGRSRR